MNMNDIMNTKCFNAVDLHCDMTYKDPYHGDRTIYPNWEDLERPANYALQIIGFEAHRKGIDIQEYINSIPEYTPKTYTMTHEYEWARWQEKHPISILNTDGEKKLIGVWNLSSIQDTRIDENFKEGDKIMNIGQGDYRTWLKVGKIVKVKKDEWCHGEISGYEVMYDDGIKDYCKRYTLDFCYF